MKEVKQNIVFVMLAVFFALFTISMPFTSFAVPVSKTEKHDKNAPEQQLNIHQGFDLQIEYATQIQLQALVFFTLSRSFITFSAKNPQVKQWFALSAFASAHTLKQNYLHILPANAP